MNPENMLLIVTRLSKSFAETKDWKFYATLIKLHVQIELVHSLTIDHEEHILKKENTEFK